MATLMERKSGGALMKALAEAMLPRGGMIVGMGGQK